MVSIATVEKALKTLYIGAISDQLNTETDPFSSRIRRTSEAITGNNGIVRAAQIGLNGGFGAGTETGALPDPGENMYENLTSTTKNLYGTIRISDKALKSIRGNDKGAFANLIQREIDTMIKTAKWHFARQIYGSAKGKLATCKANSTAGNKIAVDSTQFLIPGITIDILNSTGGDVAVRRRVKDVDHKNKTITISGAATAVTATDFIVTQKSHNLELTGLEDIFNTSLTTLYGVTRANHSWINPLVDTMGSITETGLQDAITRCEDVFNVKIDYISAGNDAYLSYMRLLKTYNRIVNTTTLKGGATALKFNELDIVRNKFAPRDGMDLLDTSVFTIDEVADWDWIEGPTRSIFNQTEGAATYNATLVKYADLMCLTPGGLCRLKGITDPAEA